MRSAYLLHVLVTGGSARKDQARQGRGKPTASRVAAAFAVRQLVLAKCVTTMVRFGWLLVLSMAGARVLEHRFANVFAARQQALARCLMTMVPLD